MQRDFDLVVTLLGALRDADAVAVSQQDLLTAVQASMPESAPSATLITHHLNILSDAGLIATLPQGTSDQMWRLTWKGHDALEQEEEDDEDESLG